MGDTFSVNLEGDINRKWDDGDIVWAKYIDFPWWPAQIECNNNNNRRCNNNRRRRRNKTRIKCKWFGDGFESNQCELMNVIEYDPEDMDRIFIEVNDEDIALFEDAVDDANTAYLRLCEKRGYLPLQTAIKYEEKRVALNSDYVKTQKRRKRNINFQEHKDGNYEAVNTQNKNKASIPPPLEPIFGDV